MKSGEIFYDEGKKICDLQFHVTKISSTNTIVLDSGYFNLFKDCGIEILKLNISGNSKSLKLYLSSYNEDKGLTVMINTRSYEGLSGFLLIDANKELKSSAHFEFDIGEKPLTEIDFNPSSSKFTTSPCNFTMNATQISLHVNAYPPFLAALIDLSYLENDFSDINTITQFIFNEENVVKIKTILAQKECRVFCVNNENGEYSPSQFFNIDDLIPLLLEYCKDGNTGRFFREKKINIKK